MVSDAARAAATLAFSGRTLPSVPGLVAQLGVVKAAAARANLDADVLAPERAAAIEAAALALGDGRFDEELVAGPLAVDPLGGGGGIGVHHAVDELIARAATEALGSGAEPVDPKGEVAASQSTADVLHTAARLAVLGQVEELVHATRLLEAEVAAAAERFGDVPTLARTCLQDALAVPARLLFDGSRDALARRRGVLVAAAAPLREVVLGATVVGDGTGAPTAYRAAVVGRLAERTGLALVASPAPASALQHGDDLLDVSAAVVGLSMVAAKLAADLRLLSSGPVGGFGEVRLPDVLEGSAFFATKRNPVVAETAVQAAAVVAGADAAVRAAIGRAELHLAGYDLTAAIAVLDATTALARALDALARHAIAGLELDEARCRALAASAAPVKPAPSAPAARPFDQELDR